MLPWWVWHGSQRSRGVFGRIQNVCCSAGKWRVAAGTWILSFFVIPRPSPLMLFQGGIIGEHGMPPSSGRQKAARICAPEVAPQLLGSSLQRSGRQPDARRKRAPLSLCSEEANKIQVMVSHAPVGPPSLTFSPHVGIFLGCCAACRANPIAGVCLDSIKGFLALHCSGVFPSCAPANPRPAEFPPNVHNVNTNTQISTPLP